MTASYKKEKKYRKKKPGRKQNDLETQKKSDKSR